MILNHKTFAETSATLQYPGSKKKKTFTKTKVAQSLKEVHTHCKAAHQPSLSSSTNAPHSTMEVTTPSAICDVELGLVWSSIRQKVIIPFIEGFWGQHKPKA